MDSNNESKPWLDPNGRLYSDDALKEISKTWDPSTWERFLSETIDVPQRELVQSTEERAINEYLTGEEKLDEMPRNELHALIRQLMRRHLSIQQQTILRMIYWENRSEREIAETLGLTKSRVPTQKSKSLSKLKRLLENRVGTFPMGKDTNQISTQGETNYEDSSEVSA